MNDECKLEIDGLAIALTKPAMQFGVPMAAFYGSVMIHLLGWMLTQNFTANKILLTALFILSFAITHLAMCLKIIKDPYGLGLAWINLKYFRPHFNYKLWGNTESFSS